MQTLFFLILVTVFALLFSGCGSTVSLGFGEGDRRLDASFTLPEKAKHFAK